MNKKDYKEISEIIKNCNAYTTPEKIFKVHLSGRLADYFEKEDKKRTINEVWFKFDRKQFLKDCGIGVKNDVS